MEDQPKNDEAASTDLQFDRAEFGGAEADPGVALQCTTCGEPITGAYFEINGEVACEACREKAVAFHTGGSKVARVVRATLLGVVAGAVGAGIYYGISALTGYEFGLIAILVGFMVGFAVHFGSHGRGGWFYQLLAVGLTYASIVSTYVPQVAEGLRQVEMEPAGELVEQVEVAPQESEPPEPQGVFVEESDLEEMAAPAITEGAESAAAAATSENAGQEAAAGGDAPLAQATIPYGIVFWGITIAIAFAAPFLMGFENILGILIIGFGLWQAWRINRKQPFEVGGPFQVGAARAEHA